MVRENRSEAIAPEGVSVTEEPRSKDLELSQYESEEDFEPQEQKPDDAMSDVDATLDGNENADDRVRIEQPDGQRAPRAPHD
jgi:hypothetical protein